MAPPNNQSVESRIAPKNDVYQPEITQIFANYWWKESQQSGRFHTVAGSDWNKSGRPTNTGPLRWYYYQLSARFLTVNSYSAHLVLTAAHCLESYSARPFFIYYDTVTPNDRTTKFAQADAITWHESYVGRMETTPAVRFEHDIGLLHFAQPLNFSGGAKPACLPWLFETFPQYSNKIAQGVVSGWGVSTVRTINTQNAYQSCDLLKVTLLAMSTEECNAWYQNIYRRPSHFHSGTFPPLRMTDNMFCAGPVETEFDPDFGFGGFCLGDSGGGFDYNNEGNIYTVGIISTVYLGVCGQKFPNKFVKITSYLSWIE